jgi:hypothetical protein
MRVIEMDRRALVRLAEEMRDEFEIYKFWADTHLTVSSDCSEPGKHIYRYF